MKPQTLNGPARDDAAATASSPRIVMPGTRVTVAAIIAAIALYFPLMTVSALPRFWPFFYASVCVLSIAHWVLLAALVNLLFSKRTMTLISVGAFAFFAISLALALCYVAIKTDRILLLPTTIAIVLVPAVVTLYCLVMGIAGLVRFDGHKEK